MAELNILENNAFLERLLWIGIPAVIIALIVAFAIWRYLERRREKNEEEWAVERRKLEVVDGIEERKDDGGKKMREFERARREAEIFAEKAAESTNTLIGGKARRSAMKALQAMFSDSSAFHPRRPRRWTESATVLL